MHFNHHGSSEQRYVVANKIFVKTLSSTLKYQPKQAHSVVDINWLLSSILRTLFSWFCITLHEVSFETHIVGISPGNTQHKCTGLPTAVERMKSSKIMFIQKSSSFSPTEEKHHSLHLSRSISLLCFSNFNLKMLLNSILFAELISREVTKENSSVSNKRRVQSRKISYL